MNYRHFISIILVFILSGVCHAGEMVDLIGGEADSNDDGSVTVADSEYILEAAWECADPYGEYGSELGAAAALNRALGLVFSGHASPAQLEMQLEMAVEHSGNGYRMAPFAVEILDRLQTDFTEGLPEPMELRPFSLEPSYAPDVYGTDQHIIAVRYDEEEYLERLLQRLYFKLIQGPVLLTVPYCASAPHVPEEYRNWDNFRYASNDDVMTWNDTRLVWVDWDLVQTVVLMYEDGRIACYDSGQKYYIDHTAAVCTAGAMLAHPDLQNMPEDIALNYVLASVEE